MTFDLLAALTVYAFVMSITPGPNNLMLMASGANFGFRRTLPHLAGVSLGFAFLAAMVGAGLAQIFETVPQAHTVLKVASVVYLLWLAWKIARAAPPDARAATGRPFGFWQAAAFQWVNPKAWAMALTAITVYAPTREIGPVLLVAAIFAAVNLPSVSIWVMVGQRLRQGLQAPARLRAFNVIMAVLLVATLIPVLAG